MNELFHIDPSRLNIWILFLIPALVNAGIFIYTCFALPQNKVNYMFSVFILLLSLWQFAEGMVRLGITEATAADWNRMSAMLLLFCASWGIFFTLKLHLREQRLPRRFLLVALVLPSIVFTGFISAGLNEFRFVNSPSWYWIANPLPGAFTICFYAWISIAALSMPAIQWYSFYKSRKGSIQRKQYLLMALGFTVPVVLGITIEVALPFFLHKDSIPLMPGLVTCFSFASLTAIRRYQLLQYSPRNQWANIVESMKEGILIIDHVGQIVYANNVFCEQMGYTFGEILGERADELFLDGEDRKLHLVRVMEERMAKRSGSSEMKMRTKNGDMLWMDITGTPYLDEKGGVVGSIGIYTDITRIKLNAQRLQQAQTVARMGSWELDFSTGVAVWSEEACRIYGLSPQENVHSFKSWLSFIHPDDMDMVTKEIARAQNDLGESSMVHRIVRRDGAVRYVNSISNFSLDSKGRPVGMYGIAHDITETKMLEQSLKATNKDLETFIYKSSHDLRGPLSSILGLVTIAEMEVKEKNALDYIDAIGELAGKLDGLLIKLVKVMSIKDKSGNRMPVDMGKMLNSLLDSLRYKEGFRNIKFTIDNNLAAPLVTDPEAMSSVLLNLVENAIKYHDYSKPNPEIGIRIHKNDSPYLLIEVEDNGRGIPASAREKVFDMFYRGNSDSKGSGLGLYIVKSNLKKLGGDIELRSEEGKGTIFSIKMPMAA